MLHVNLYLYQPKHEKATRIIARFFSDGVRLKYKTGISIHPQLWDFDKQRIKSSIKVPHHIELNNQLEKIISVSVKTYWEYRENSDGRKPTMSELKEIVDRKLNGEKTEKKTEKKMELLDFFQKLIDQSLSGVRLNPANGKPICISTVQTYITTINHLKEYQKLYKRKIQFDNIDLLFYNQYTEYLIKELRLSSNSVGKNIQVLKLVMNDAVELGLCKNLAYKSKRFLTIREKSDSIYLDKSELQEMEKLELSDHQKLENVRDLF